MSFRLLFRIAAASMILLPGMAAPLVLFDSINTPQLGSVAYSGTDEPGDRAGQHFTTGGFSVVLTEVTVRFRVGKHGACRFSIFKGSAERPDGTEIAVLFDGWSTSLGPFLNGYEEDVTFSGLNLLLAPGEDYWVALTNNYTGPPSMAGIFDLTLRETTGSGAGFSPRSAFGQSRWREEAQPLMMTLKVEYPAGATLATTSIAAEDDAGFKRVDLSVGVSNGPLPLADLQVLWSPDLAGPWTEIGTIPGDGMTFTGHVELPDDPVDGPVKRAFFIAEAR